MQDVEAAADSVFVMNSPLDGLTKLRSDCGPSREAAFGLIGKALDYSRKRWAALSRYLDDGAVPIDNIV